jgi:4-carboxymuconolactone decarboxylase
VARLPYIDPTDTPAAVQQALTVLPPLNIFLILGHAATAFQPYLRLAAAILGELELDPALRELAILQVAKQSDPEYEWVQHVAIGQHAGLTPEQITAVETGDIADHPSLDTTQRAVLTFTREVVHGPHVSATTFEAVNERLNPREIVELLLTIGNYLMLAKIMTTLEIEIDDPIGNTVVALSRTPPDTPPDADQR